MFLQSLPLVFVLTGLALYTVLAGADFGAGFWQLFAGRDERGERVREYAHRSMAPVWEANHVWLIFILTVFWTAYPRAFEAIASTLSVALFVAAVGIVFRGAAYAMRSGAASARESGAIDTVFSLSSLLTPFALGAAVGGIASGRVPVGNAAGHLFSSWLNPISIFVGVLAVTSCAYLAAVYLAADAAHDGLRELEREFRARALGAGVVAGLAAVGGIFVADADSPQLYHELVSAAALPALIVSGLAGLTTLGLVYRRRYEPARYLAALAVASIIAGMALARWPTILPGLTVSQAAAGHETLVWVTFAVLGGGAIVFPSLALLFRLALTGRFRAGESSPAAGTVRAPARSSARPLGRVAVACLLGGFGLLNVAEASWAHGIGVALLLAFIAVGFVSLIFTALGAEPSQSGSSPGMGVASAQESSNRGGPPP